MRFILPFASVFDLNGHPLPGAKLYFYETGTNTAKDTYSDSGLTTPNANPVVANNQGEFDDIFLSGAYRVTLTDSANVVQPNYPADNVPGQSGTTVLNIAALKLIEGTSDQRVFMLGGVSAGDGDGGHFYWNSTSTATNNDDTVIQATAVTTGRWLRLSKNKTTVDTITELKIAPTGVGVIVLGHTTVGDGGGGEFYWDSTSTDTDNNGTIIQATGVATGRWKRIYTGNLKGAWFGTVGDGTTDDYTAITAAITAAEVTGASVLLEGEATYAIGTRLSLTSANHTKLIGETVLVTLKWIGAALTIGANDDATGAMLELVGTDHAWSGAENITFDGAGLAVHGMYLVGSVNLGVSFKGLRFTGLLGDGIFHDSSGSLGPVMMRITDCYGLPTASLGGKTAACGRSIFHFSINNSVGAVYIDNISTDNGGDCVILWETSTFAAMDLIVDNVRWENWENGADFIQTDHSTVTTMGRIQLNGIKASSSGGTLGALVHNISTVDARMVVNVTHMVTNDAYSALFTDDTTPANDVAYDSKYIGVPFVLNANANTSILVKGTAHAATPISGGYFWNDSDESLNIHDGDENNRFTLKEKILNKSSAYTVTLADLKDALTLTNGGAAGTVVFTLPAIATVGLGRRAKFWAQAAQIITLTPDAADAIYSSAAGANFSSSGALYETIEIESGPSSRWYLVASPVGTWA